jgi:hypothetical protein
VTLKLPKTPSQWSPDWQTRLNQTLEIEDTHNLKVGIAVGKLVLQSPNGARWQITVSNAGVIGATALP